MSSQQRNNVTQPERNRMMQTTMNNFTSRSAPPPIQHQGYADNLKLSENARMLTINIKGIDPWNNHQMEMLLESCKECQIDVLLLCETNVK